jgi:hypothetical protein
MRLFNWQNVSILVTHLSLGPTYHINLDLHSLQGILPVHGLHHQPFLENADMVLHQLVCFGVRALAKAQSLLDKLEKLL